MVRIDSASKTPWTVEGQEKRAAVQEMFAEIAPTYDLCNALMSLSLHKRWRAYAANLLQLNQGEAVLDLCSGTGDFLIPLRKLVGSEGKVVGGDFCLPMLERAKNKQANALLLADAASIPLKSAVFSAVSVGWGIRNVPDVDATHKEIVRVLKPKGRFVSLDMARPQNESLRGASEWVFNNMVPLLGTLFRRKKAYTYLPKSTARFKTREELKASMEKAGLVDVQYKDLFFGNICIHWGMKP